MNKKTEGHAKQAATAESVLKEARGWLNSFSSRLSIERDVHFTLQCSYESVYKL